MTPPRFPHPRLMSPDPPLLAPMLVLLALLERLNVASDHLGGELEIESLTEFALRLNIVSILPLDTGREGGRAVLSKF